ncbi:MAG: endonuclease [Candidatus Aenigmatarchaeota archaeon]
MRKGKSNRKSNKLIEAYKSLLKKFGHQNWWPVNRNFKPKEWEICVGAILTQNTNWRNVEKALDNLAKAKIISPADVQKTELKKLEELIRPSGFYKQKAIRLKALADFVLGFGSFENFKKNIERSELLKVKGVGFETCDSILLYACGKRYFVIDAYTKRFIKSLGIRTKMDYESLRKYFEKRLPRSVSLYKEFHALIVEWGKESFRIVNSKE